MTEIHGKGVSGGIAIGRLNFQKQKEVCVKRRRIDDASAEMKRFENAKKEAVSQLEKLYEKALREVGEANARIFEIHQMMLDDSDYNESVENFIVNQKLNAEYAVALTSDNFAEMFSSMEDEYMQGRAADVRDISDRLVNNLMNRTNDSGLSFEQAIICADDLAPSETVQMDKSKVIAFCTSSGSANSHTAILARTMNIPAIIGLGDKLSSELDGMEAIVDGNSGTLYIDPDKKTKEKLTAKLNEEQNKRELLLQLRGKENITLDGQKINIYANIGGLNDLGAVLANDADGIGLFRSEFLYLENTDYPNEEEQFQCYKRVLERMAGKKVIIRTLDIGADKQIDYFKLKREENPALGFRAIRICLERPEIFKTQLRALYRASMFGNLGIMFPMITSLEEITRTKEIVSQVKDELSREGVPFRDDVETGIMIETPAAALISDLLAREVDFFSVGTNDLTQYTLAVDRQNPALESFCDVHHKALLRLIKFTADNAHKNGIWIGICGELGADTELTEAFLSMDIDELSVSPALVLSLRDKIRKTSIKSKKDILEKLL